MYGAGHHKLIAQLLIKITSFADDDAEIETKGRLRQTPNRRKPYASSPSIELIPDPPSNVLSSGSQEFNRLDAAHRGSGIDALPLKIGRIIKAAWIQRAARRTQFHTNRDAIALIKQPFWRTPRQPDYQLITFLRGLVKSDDHNHSIRRQLDRRDNPSAVLLNNLKLLFLKLWLRRPFNSNRPIHNSDEETTESGRRPADRHTTLRFKNGRSDRRHTQHD